MEEEEQKMKNKASREAARRKKKAERLRNRKLKLQQTVKNPFIHQFSSGRKEVWIMPGMEMPHKRDQLNGCGHGGVANCSSSMEAGIEDYYATFTHSEVCVGCTVLSWFKKLYLSSTPCNLYIHVGSEEASECISCYTWKALYQNWVGIMKITIMSNK